MGTDHLGKPNYVRVEFQVIKYTGLFEMIVGVLTTRHTRSPDATPCDFFLWGYVKDQVYVPSLPASIPELKVQIVHLLGKI